MGLDKDRELDELLNLFSHGFNSLFTANPPCINIISDDPDDKKFIEWAVGLEADHIISGDKHLLNLREYCGIKISSPREFLDIYQWSLQWWWLIKIGKYNITVFVVLAENIYS